jgi:hypothetical protein
VGRVRVGRVREEKRRRGKIREEKVRIKKMQVCKKVEKPRSTFRSQNVRIYPQHSERTEALSHHFVEDPKALKAAAGTVGGKR